MWSSPPAIRSGEPPHPSWPGLTRPSRSPVKPGDDNRRKPPLALQFQNIETIIAVGEVDEAALVDLDIVRLRARPAAARLGDERGDFARRARVGNIDDPQPAAEPGAIHQAVMHPLGELMRAKASARSA